MGGAVHTEAALMRYAQRKIASHQPFHFTDELSYQNLAGSGMGFLPALAAVVAKVAPTIASVASTAAAVKGMRGSKADPNAIAEAILPEVRARLAAEGVNLPADAAKPITLAGVLDAFGEQYRPFVIGGVALLAAMLLMRRK